MLEDWASAQRGRDTGELFKEMVGGLAGEQVPGSGTEVYSPVGVGLETGEMTV